jgi:LmbE family N-acetylglucosaminyl deacetylase
MEKIAVIAAHPDDETLGCGGTLLKHKQQNDRISLLFMTDGIGARSSADQQGKLNRKKGLSDAMNFLKPVHWHTLNLPDNQLDTVLLLTIVQSIEDFINRDNIDILYTHFIGDLNIDHALTCKAVMTATRPGSKTFVKEIYSFKVPSSTEWAIGKEQFHSDTYVDTSDYIEQKKRYLACYQGEMRIYLHPRSIQNILTLKQLRGSQANLEYAEAFMTLRRIIND